jgi:hypothetical protein
MPRAGARRGRQRVGGVGVHHFAIRGSDAPETKSPRMGFRGWDSGKREGWMGAGAGAGSGGVSDTPPPARSPLGG